MTIAQKIQHWLRWNDQRPGKFKHLKPGCDPSSILSEHGKEIIEAVSVYDALKRRAQKIEAT